MDSGILKTFERLFMIDQYHRDIAQEWCRLDNEYPELEYMEIN